MGFKSVIITVFLLTLFGFVSMAQDVAGSSDHAIFNRIPGFSIKEYRVEESGSHTFYDENNREFIAGGKKTSIYYECNCEESPLKIIRSFSDAIKKRGGKSLEYADNKVYMSISREGAEILTEVSAGENYYTLIIIEKAVDQQEITAGSMLEELNESGRVILYIGFDSGGSLISPESMNIVEQVVKLLILDPKLLLGIEGYTDSTGSEAANQKLSEDRALAVKNAIIEKGIDASRLRSVGYGENIPITDNATEKGRVLNNRIGLIKLSY